jgi:hypothetical protein
MGREILSEKKPYNHLTPLPKHLINKQRFRVKNMKKTKENMERKERIAEDEFMKWLNKHQTPYLYIQQDIKTFSAALRKHFSRRPDFMILVPHIGFILTDVEFKKPAKKYKTFYINEDETKRYCNLHSFFNLQVWYVFSHEDYHFNTWFWIPALKVPEFGKIRTNPNTKEAYFAVPLDKFITVSATDTIERIFSETPKFF